MSVIDAAFARTRTVLLTLVLLLVAGTIAFVTIAKESSPDVNIPIIYVSMHHSGISPEDAERMLVKPMEKELQGIEGVKEMSSTAYEGGGFVLLEFDAGFNADAALEDVRRQVDVAKAELPEETDEPTVNEVNISLFPVLVVTLSGAVAPEVLIDTARALQDELEALPRVLEVDIAGDREEMAEILIDPVLLESYGLSASEFINFVQRSNRLIAAGSLEPGAGRFAIKVPGLLETVDDIMGLPVKVSGDAVVTLQDVATGRRTFKDPTSIARVDGQPAIALEVKKRIGENIIDTVNAVKARVAEEQAHWPAEISVGYLQDQSNEIRTMLSDLQNSVLSAVLLVMIVVVAALGLRSAGLVGLAIPGSFVTAILVLYTLGLTINLVVLFALILAVGMLVDGAIVVTEYADRKMREGQPPREAYRMAAKRMAWPIIASTATTLAAFLPLLFWTGVVGEFMKFLPITLLATLSASLLMALVFVPTLGGVIGRAGKGGEDTMKALSAGEGHDLDHLPGITGFYVRTLRLALRRPTLVLLAAVLGLVASYAAYGKWGAGVEFFPEVEPDQASVLVHARGNLSIWEKNDLVKEVEARILDLPGIRHVYSRTGEPGRGDESAPDQIGRILLEFDDWDARRPADAILGDIRERAADIAGIWVETRKQEGGPPVGKPIQVQVSARDTAQLEPAVRHLRQGLAAIGDVRDVEDSRPVPGIEWEVRVDRTQASKFGADVASVGNMVQLVTNGLTVSTYRPEGSDDEVDIITRFPLNERSLDRLDRLRLNTESGAVPISNFVRLTPRPRTGDINRVDGRRVLTVKADVAPHVLADDKLQDFRAWLAENPLPEGVSLTYKGEDEEQKKSQAFLGKAFGVALFLMALILVTQFNSFYFAFLILSAVVLSTVGVMLGLLVTGEPFGIVMSGVGVIALAGIVVNNNIVLLDTYQRLEKTENSRLEAILHTGAQRLRPVILTTLTTALGLLPMSFRLNLDFVNREISHNAPSMQWWSQLSTAVVAGMLFATVLTLVVTPSALMVRANVLAWRDRRRQRRRERQRAA